MTLNTMSNPQDSQPPVVRNLGVELSGIFSQLNQSKIMKMSGGPQMSPEELQILKDSIAAASNVEVMIKGSAVTRVVRKEGEVEGFGGEREPLDSTQFETVAQPKKLQAATKGPVLSPTSIPMMLQPPPPPRKPVVQKQSQDFSFSKKEASPPDTNLQVNPGAPSPATKPTKEPKQTKAAKAQTVGRSANVERQFDLSDDLSSEMYEFPPDRSKAKLPLPVPSTPVGLPQIPDTTVPAPKPANLSVRDSQNPYISKQTASTAAPGASTNPTTVTPSALPPSQVAVANPQVPPAQPSTTQPDPQSDDQPPHDPTDNLDPIISSSNQFYADGNNPEHYPTFHVYSGQNSCWMPTNSYPSVDIMNTIVNMGGPFRLEVFPKGKSDPVNCAGETNTAPNQATDPQEDADPTSPIDSPPRPPTPASPISQPHPWPTYPPTLSTNPLESLEYQHTIHTNLVSTALQPYHPPTSVPVVSPMYYSMRTVPVIVYAMPDGCVLHQGMYPHQWSVGRVARGCGIQGGVFRVRRAGRRVGEGHLLSDLVSSGDRGYRSVEEVIELEVWPGELHNPDESDINEASAVQSQSPTFKFDQTPRKVQSAVDCLEHLFHSSVGYSIKPSFSTLLMLPEVGLNSVDHLELSNTHGAVRFCSPINLLNLSLPRDVSIQKNYVEINLPGSSCIVNIFNVKEKYYLEYRRRIEGQGGKYVSYSKHIKTLRFFYSS